MRSKLIHVLCLLTTQRHDGAQDALLVHDGQVRARHHHLGKDEARVRRKRPHLRLPPAADARRDPVHGDYGDHDGLRLGVLLEVNRVGDDVRHLVDVEAAVAARIEDGGAIVFEDGGELSGFA